MRIEPLECRIAPAATFTYFDLDGDKVTITSSKGTNADLAAVLFFDSTDPNDNRQLRTIDLSLNAVFAGANLSITARPEPDRGGDGLVNVGRIDADLDGGDAGDTALDLGVVKIKGDLGELDAGDSDLETPAVKSLSVQSLGQFGLFTQGGFGSLVSNFNGSLGKLTVAGDIRDAYIRIGGGANLGSATIGGSVVGGIDQDTGEIFAEGDLGPVTVKGDIIGGVGTFAGSIGAGRNVASVTVLGSLVGGLGTNSGWIFAGFLGAGTLGAVKIGHNVQGGSGMNSGFIESRNGDLTSVSISGSLLGGKGERSGEIFSFGDMGAVKVAHDVKGGAGNFSGRIFSNAALASLTIGGTLVGGSGSHFDADSDDDGQVFSRGDMGPIKVAHDVQGVGVYTGTIKTLGKLASVTIGGSLSAGAVLSGGIESAGDMGAIKIGYDLRGRDADSGFIDSAGKIASISIGGSLVGGSGNDSGVIESSGDIGAVKIGHDVIGGGGVRGGLIDCGGKLASVSIGGSLIGGSETDSGQIHSGGDMGAIKIGNDVLGGASGDSGLIESFGKLASVRIGGSLVGATGSRSGAIFTTGDIGTVSIGHNLAGGSIIGSTLDVSGSGAIISISGRIASVAIGGSVLAGRDDSTTGTLIENAAIRAALDIGSIAVKGSVTGTVGTGSTGADKTLVIFSARGQAAPTATTDLAIGKLSIGGSAEWLNVLAGHVRFAEPSNGNAQIGTVVVGGDWIASNLVAGVENYGVNNGDDVLGADDDINFGDAADNVIDDLPDSIAKIASITIKGIVRGTQPLNDHFGFVSHAIGRLKINGTAIPIAGTVDLSPLTGNDVTVHLV